jgi:hypothetical protein
MMRAWPTWMAILGLGLLGLEAVIVAPASAPSAVEVFGRQHFVLQSMATQFLLVGALLTVLAAGLTLRSRLAFAVAFLVGLVPLGAWMYALASLDPAARQPLALLVATPSLLVVIGLLEAWPDFWERPRGKAESKPSVGHSRRRS